MIIFKRLFILTLGLFTLGTAGSALADHVNAKNGVAVKGHDVVSYFDLEPGANAVKGDSSITSTYNGVAYHFSSAANKAKFDENPGGYAPQYGGYCAYAVSNGYLVGIDPNAWAVVDGKLYLNYTKKVQGIWEQDIPGYIKGANEQWKTLGQDKHN